MDAAAKVTTQADPLIEEMRGLPVKLLRELSNRKLGDYLNRLRQRADQLAQAARERDEARRGCMRLREDSARLDWLMGRLRTIGIPFDREAIDFARSQESET